jgi:hypothetical protein
MTKRFVGGQMQKGLPTKRDLIDSYDERLKSLATAISQVAQIGARSDQQIQQNLMGLSSMLGDVATDFRALLKMLEAEGLSIADHEKMVEKIQIEDFEMAVKMEDAGKSLIPVEGASSLGQYIVVKMEAFQPDTGAKLEKFSKLRSRVQIGSGDIHPVMEQELVGLKVGDTKEFTFKMPEQLPDKEFAGKDVKFKVEVIDLKQEPLKPTVEAPLPDVTPVQENVEVVKTSE